MNECGLELDCFLCVWFDRRLGLSREKEETCGENVTGSRNLVNNTLGLIVSEGYQTS